MVSGAGSVTTTVSSINTESLLHVISTVALTAGGVVFPVSNASNVNWMRQGSIVPEPAGQYRFGGHGRTFFHRHQPSSLLLKVSIKIANCVQHRRNSSFHMVLMVTNDYFGSCGSYKRSWDITTGKIHINGFGFIAAPFNPPVVNRRCARYLVAAGTC